MLPTKQHVGSSLNPLAISTIVLECARAPVPVYDRSDALLFGYASSLQSSSFVVLDRAAIFVESDPLTAQEALLQCSPNPHDLDAVLKR